jgi:hypothetical protein
MMLFRSLFLAATVLSFSLVDSHDRLLQLENCNGEIASLFFNFFIELDVSEGCEGNDLDKIGSYIQDEINTLIGYIPGNNEFIEANLCPTPKLLPSEDRFLKAAKTGKYSYYGGGECLRCMVNKRLNGATVSNGAKRKLKGTNKTSTKSQTEERTDNMTKQEEILQKALNQSELEMTDGEMQAGNSSKDAEQELDKPAIEMRTFGANDSEFKFGITVEIDNLVVLASLIVKMLPGDLIDVYSLEDNGCLDKVPNATVKIVLLNNETRRLSYDDCDDYP